MQPCHWRAALSFGRARCCAMPNPTSHALSDKPSTARSATLDQTLPADGPMSAANRRAMAAIMLAVALATLDTAIANTALPAIATDLHAQPAASVWIINAYQLAMVATLLPFPFVPAM